MFKLYEILTIIVSPFVRCFLFWRLLKNKEDKLRYKERLGITGTGRPDGKLTWIHAASVGESLSVLPIIEMLLKERPDTHILITTGTVTSAKLLASKLPKNAIHQYVPVDVSCYIARFLKHWRPDLAILVESELWPNLINKTAKYCKLIMVNGRISNRSFKKWQKYPDLVKLLLSNFTICMAQSQQDADHLNRLGAPNVKYLGNIKYDAPELEYNQEKLKALQAAIGQRKVFLAASTHSDEEVNIAKCHINLKQNFSDLLTIIIPRHPSRANEINQSIQNLKLATAVRSNSIEITDSTDIYIADTMGELGLFYRLTDIVFVGGSLVKHGGQNFLEPARLGAAVIVGPHTFNFTEIRTEFEKHEAIITVNNYDELGQAVDKLFNDTTFKTALVEKSKQLVKQKNGVIKKVVAEIIKL